LTCREWRIERNVHRLFSSPQWNAGDLYHQGLVITHGLRYLLVGFCCTGIWVVKLKPGHVDLSLRLSLNQGTEQIKQEKKKKKKKRKKRKKNKSNEEQNN
jgi:hypothetical protein